MAIREIRVVPDPVLRTPCDPIKEITPAVRHLVQDLLDTVDDPGRAGLSANQIGVSLRAFSYNIDGKIGYVLNPVLEETSGEQYGDEGCLSVPGLWYKTRRADYARVRGIDLDGKPVVLEGHGIMGRMLQHETDHWTVTSILIVWKRKNAARRCVTCAPIASDRNSERRFNHGATSERRAHGILIFVRQFGEKRCRECFKPPNYCQPVRNQFASCSRRPVSVG